MRIGTVLATFLCSLFGAAGTLAPQALAAAPHEQPYDWMYHPTEVVDIHLTLNGAQQDALNQPAKSERTWVKGVGFRMESPNGKRYGADGNPWNVEAKLKGSASFQCLRDADSSACEGRAGKAAFNLKFKDDVGKGYFRPDGLKRLTLNNMVQDPSFMRETIAYEVFRASGLPAPRTGYARLWVNDAYYGLYLNLERYNDQSLPRWFSSTQHLYEGDYHVGQDSSIHRSVVSMDGLEWFDVDEGDENDISDLEALAAAADAGAWAGLKPHFARPESLIRYLATEWYLGHWDGYSTNSNNYYLHSDAEGRFTLLPSGADQAFVAPGWTPLSFPFVRAIAGWGYAGSISRVCFNDPGCTQDFLLALASAKRTATDLDIEQRVESLSNQLTPILEEEPERMGSMEEIRAHQDAIFGFLKNRNAEVEALSRGPSSPGSMPSVSPGHVAPGVLATFEFTAGIGEVQEIDGFECSLDLGKRAPCSSPVEYTDLAPGLHVFRVRAINGHGAGPETVHVWQSAADPSAIEPEPGPEPLPEPEPEPLPQPQPQLESPGTTLGSLKLRLKGLTVKRGRRVVLRVRVSNSGTADASRVTVCGAVPGGVLRIGKCAKLGTIPASSASAARLTVTARGKVKANRKQTVILSASGSDVQTRTTKVTVRLR